MLVLAPTAGDIGFASSGTLYLAFALSNLVSPAAVGLLGPKWSLVFGTWVVTVKLRVT